MQMCIIFLFLFPAMTCGWWRSRKHVTCIDLLPWCSPDQCNNPHSDNRNCPKSCGNCESTECQDTVYDCVQKLIDNGKGLTCYRGDKGCCGTCRIVKGTDPYSCSDTSEKCSDYITTLTANVACQLFGASCCSSCERQGESSCIDDPISQCRISSKAYTCTRTLYRFDCCAYCKDYEVDPNCVDTYSECLQLYNEGALTSSDEYQCCGTIRLYGVQFQSRQIITTEDKMSDQTIEG